MHVSIAYLGNDLQTSIAIEDSPVNARGNSECTCPSRPCLQGRKRSIQSVVFKNSPWPEEAKGIGRRSRKTDD